jgi:signal peptidase I
LLSQFVIQTVRGEVLEAFRIPSGSMEPSVLVGDFIYVDKRPAVQGSVEYGTIIVFQSIEEEGMQVIHRVVGLPGDTVAMVKAGCREMAFQSTNPISIHHGEERKTPFSAPRCDVGKAST